ncbi:alanyl-tRNA editing protein [Magnetovibrio sp. PR-2]|uniref:alanyl-tRNA editing protein n=1 Tax=Magnetovibrio sp. PR-2 TaxID=3120356 RepID=UPI002FCDE38D
MTEELFREDSYLQSCEATITAVVENGVVLDKTVFYPTGGGQPGDTGVLKLSSGAELSVTDTQKGEAPGTIVHVLAEGSDRPNVGDNVSAQINWERRHKHMRMHTALHLLCALVDGQITGAQVNEAKSRIDFNIPEKPDKEALSAGLQKFIDDNITVTQSWMTDEELDAEPDLVRSMSVQPPRGTGRVRTINVEGVDFQPCGGTHVKATGEIGAMRIGKIENKGKQNRRINILFDDCVS